MFAIIRGTLGHLFPGAVRAEILSLEEFVGRVQEERCSFVEVEAKVRCRESDGSFWGTVAFRGHIHSGMTVDYDEDILEMPEHFRWPLARELLIKTDILVAELRKLLGEDVSVAFQIMTVPGVKPIVLNDEGRKWLLSIPDESDT